MTTDFSVNLNHADGSVRITVFGDMVKDSRSVTLTANQFKAVAILMGYDKTQGPHTGQARGPQEGASGHD